MNLGGPLSGIGGALGLGAGKVARAMAQEIEKALGRPERVLAMGEPLGRALAQRGLPVVAVAREAKKRKKAPPQVVASTGALPFSDGAVDAVCAAGMPAEGIVGLRELARVVRRGGVVTVATAASALVRKVAPPEVIAASMVHALLVDVEQRLLGSTLLTTGRVGPGR